jgi:hypothetical protein
MWRMLGFIAVVAASMALWVTSCSGPQPEVGGVQLVEPSGEDAPYRVQATVRNQGPGHGEVTVTARLRDRASGRTVQHEGKARLEAHETTLVTIELQAPRGSYTPEVEVDYPPR